MSSALRTGILFTAILLLMLAGAFFYLKRSDVGVVQSVSGSAPVAGQAQATPAAEISPEIENGLLAMREDRLEDAIATLESVPDSDPGYPIALQGLGEAYGRAGRGEDSVAVLKRLIALQPENANAYVSLSLAHYRMGRFKEAEFAVLRALESDPSNIAARYNVALYRVAQGRVTDAIPAYQRAFANDPQHTYLAQAQVDLRGLHLTYSELPDPHYALAFFAFSLGAREQEYEELQHFLERQPDGPIADNARVRLADAQKAVEGQ